jgi:DNA-binding NtrC family response regulator
LIFFPLIRTFSPRGEGIGATMLRVLIIDDGVDIANYCHQFISDGFEYVHVRNGKGLSKDLKKNYNLILLDKSFTKIDKSELLGPADDADNEGLRILAAIKKLDQNIPVIMVTAHADYDSMSSALHMGAFDYVEWDALQKDSLFLKLKMERAIQWQKTARNELVEKYNSWGLIGKSEPMVRLFQQLETALNSDSTTLLRGDTGTGKDLVARIIHEHGPRGTGPFVTVDLPNIQPNVMESELFGHERGAFTDAKEKRKGRFALAHGGTIFLDEIGDLSTNLQPKLLRLVQDKRVDPMGASAPVEVDVRIISATNQNIENMIVDGSFRQDLYYRLKVLEIRLPSLAERTEDLPLLVDYFLSAKTEEMGKEAAGITREAMSYLLGKEWKGNVRELENTMETAVKKADRLITLKDLLISASASPETTGSSTRGCTREEPAQDCPVFSDADMSQIEKVAIVNALRSNGGLVEPASKALGLSKSTIYNKINEYSLAHLVRGYAERDT